MTFSANINANVFSMYYYNHSLYIVNEFPEDLDPKPGQFYFLVTPMANPEYCVPRQFASSRKVRPGDVIATEITAQFFDDPGQILRTFAVAAEPTPLFRRLHETAEAAFDAVTGVIRHGATMQQIIDANGAWNAWFMTCWNCRGAIVFSPSPSVCGSIC